MVGGPPKYFLAEVKRLVQPVARPCQHPIMATATRPDSSTLDAMRLGLSNGATLTYLLLQEHGGVTTIRQIATDTGRMYATVRFWIVELRRAGLIEQDTRKRADGQGYERTWRVADHG